MITCPNCGTVCSDGTTYCAHCGCQLVQPQVVMPFTNITPRSIGLCVLFYFLTCGIYLFYWLYVLTDEINELSRDVNATSGGMVLLYSFLTCGIYTYYWMYKQGERIDNAKMQRGLPTDGNTGILYLLLCFLGFGIISYCLMQNEVNKMVS